MHYLGDEDDDEPIGHWFTGNCDNCLKKIKKMEYAVRKPIFTGGWNGCFCSFKCVLDKINEEIGNLGDGNTDEEDLAAIVLHNLTIPEIQKTIENNGIYVQK